MTIDVNNYFKTIFIQNNKMYKLYYLIIKIFFENDAFVKRITYVESFR